MLMSEGFYVAWWDILFFYARNFIFLREEIYVHNVMNLCSRLMNTCSQLMNLCSQVMNIEFVVQKKKFLHEENVFSLTKTKNNPFEFCTIILYFKLLGESHQGFILIA